MLSGKYLGDAPGARYSESDTMGRKAQLPIEKLQRLKSLAEAHGMSMATLSLAWVAAQPGVTSPIIGARSVAQLQESAAALEVPIPEELSKALDELFTPGDFDVVYYQSAFGPNKRPR